MVIGFIIKAQIPISFVFSSIESRCPAQRIMDNKAVELFRHVKYGEINTNNFKTIHYTLLSFAF